MSTKAEIVLQANVRFEARAESGHSVVIDGPAEAGGENAGFRPMELMLVGMGGCMALDVLLILRRMRQQVAAYRVTIHAERAEDPPRVYTEVRLEHIFQGGALEASAVQRAIELAETKYCSGSAMFAKTAKITNSFRILPG